MTKRERIAGIFIVAGMFLTATDSLFTVFLAVVLMGLGALVLNLPRRAKKARRRTRNRFGRAA